MTCPHFYLKGRILSIVLLLRCISNMFCDEFSPGDGMTWNFGSSSSSSSATDSTLDDIPIIVWWTDNLFPHMNKWETLSCPNSRCYSTHESAYANHSQTTVFYFYGTDFKPMNLPLPRLSKHIWALAHEESPLNNFVLDHAVAMNVFNYTATYHRAADFPITTVSFPGPDFILNRQPVPVSKKNYYQKKDNLAPVVYVQSHCEVPSDRDRYVGELMEYIKVDSYGWCNFGTCSVMGIVRLFKCWFTSSFILYSYVCNR